MGILWHGLYIVVNNCCPWKLLPLLRWIVRQTGLHSESCLFGGQCTKGYYWHAPAAKLTHHSCSKGGCFHRPAAVVWAKEPQIELVKSEGKVENSSECDILGLLDIDWQSEWQLSKPKHLPETIHKGFTQLYKTTEDIWIHVTIKVYFSHSI